MLREIPGVRQIEGEARRRWFMDGDLELLVWISQDGRIVAFELCYNRNGDERALTWNDTAGFSHHWVDDGEGRPGKMKAAPILIRDGWFDREGIAARFRRESHSVDADISAFVHEKILQYSA